MLFNTTDQNIGPRSIPSRKYLVLQTERALCADSETTREFCVGSPALNVYVGESVWKHNEAQYGIFSSFLRNRSHTQFSVFNRHELSSKPLVC